MTQSTIDTASTPTLGAPRPVRVLAGFLAPPEGPGFVLGCMTVPLTLQDQASAMAVYSECRDAVVARSPINLGSPIVDGDRTLLDPVLGWPEVQAAVGLPFRVEWVDLSRVISIQKFVFTDGLDDRVAAAAVGEVALRELCLPAGPQSLELKVSPSGRGFTVSSPNPNLTLIGKADGPTMMFAPSLRSPYLTVAQYEGYFYLSNGHHRAAGLVRRGVTVVPAIVIEPPSFNVAGGVGLAQFGADILSTPVPPLVTDFWDGSVAVDSTQLKLNKYFRVTVDEFED